LPLRGALCQPFVFFGYAQQFLLLARIIFKDVDGRIRPDQEWKLEVTDENKTPLFLIHVAIIAM
jgi:hypothetical protein